MADEADINSTINAQPNGAAAGPQAMVILASGLSAISLLRRPVERMASPTRVEVIKRILMDP